MNCLIFRKQHLGHLRPLGLSILLNTCNIRTEEQYTNFYNHLVNKNESYLHLTTTIYL
jgi:hypothetical protein